MRHLPTDHSHPPHNHQLGHSHTPSRPHHSFGGQHSQNSQAVIEALEPVFGKTNSFLIVRGVEGARPPEAGAKLMLASSTLMNLVQVCISTGIDVTTQCEWLTQPLDDSHPHAFAYNLIYCLEGAKLLEGVVPAEGLESIRYRLTHGPWEMQSLTMIELANAHLAALLFTHFEKKDKESLNGEVDG